MDNKINKANEYLKEYYNIKNPNEDDKFKYVEALEFLIEKTNDSRYMMELGGYYYECYQFELAEHYYLLAAENKNIDAYSCLGYLYYYGRVDKPDYEKAFKYYSLASDNGILEASYKLADMYKNGYYVNKDYDKYVSIIKSLYPKIKDTNKLFDPLPEIFSRLAMIYKKENKKEKALDLLFKARHFQAQRLIYSTFFGDLTIMKYIILDIYSIIEFDENDEIDLFDLFYILKSKSKVEFYYNGQKHYIEAILENNQMYVTMDNTNYENIDDFFKRAKVEGRNFSTLYFEIDYMRLTSWK